MGISLNIEDIEQPLKIDGLSVYHLPDGLPIGFTILSPTCESFLGPTATHLMQRSAWPGIPLEPSNPPVVAAVFAVNTHHFL